MNTFSFISYKEFLLKYSFLGAIKNDFSLLNLLCDESDFLKGGALRAAFIQMTSGHLNLTNLTNWSNILLCQLSLRISSYNLETFIFYFELNYLNEGYLKVLKITLPENVCRIFNKGPLLIFTGILCHVILRHF